ncbi:hypothetical protein MTO96_052314 [Rhipicephalus appendiculatus]
MDIRAGYLLLFMLLSAWTGALVIEERSGERRTCRGSGDCGRGHCCVVRRTVRGPKTCQPRPGLNETCSSASLLNTPHHRAGKLYLYGCPCNFGLWCRRLSNQISTGLCRPFYERLNFF